MHAFPVRLYFAGLMLLGLSGAALAAPGPTIELCAACHGSDGMSYDAPLVPIIAGMPAPHIEEAINEYLDEARQCIRIHTMCETASALDEAQTALAAEHFAKQPRLASEEEFDAALAANGAALHASRCAVCHFAPDDPSVASSLGIPLEGQRKQYVRYAIDAYMRGDRLMLWDLMAGEIRVLTPDDLNALVNYYASYRQDQPIP